MESIYFKDQGSLSFKILIFSAILFAAVAIALFYLEKPSYWSLSVAALSVVLFAFTGIDNFKHPNLVNHDNHSATVKLLGRRTFGFRFKAVKMVSLMEKGLIIEVDGQEPITLSRKRYKEQSLKDFKNLIQKYQ